jgi:hypothetical protein
MPAGLPGDTLANNQGNPTAGPSITHDPMSGPKGSPFDSSKVDYTTGSPAGWNASTRIPIVVNDPLNVSTGGLSTGIGFGAPPIIGGAAVAGIFPDKNFTDDYVPGQSTPAAVAAADARYMYIGGGRSTIVNGSGYGLAAGGNGYPVGWFTSQPSPYALTGVAICQAGQGKARDGATRTTCGFPTKFVTAAGAVANGAVVEAGFQNRSNVAMVAGQSVLGNNIVELLVPT